MKADAIVTEETGEPMTAGRLYDDINMKIAQVKGILTIIPRYDEVECAAESLSNACWACRDLLDQCDELSCKLAEMAEEANEPRKAKVTT